MKDKTSAALLAFFLGSFGVHKFYLGQSGAGIVYLFFFWTFIPGFVSFIEAIMLLSMSQEAFNARFNPQAVAGGGSPQIQSMVVNVASPTAPDSPPQISASTQGSRDVVQQITELNNLRVSGAITEQEFNDQKQKLLSQG